MRPSIAVAAAISASLVWASVIAYSEYADAIPNAWNVPGYTNIGHLTATGRTGKNAFGSAFASANYVWTVAYCQADSDGDGQTNSQELGDPCCEFDVTTNPVVRWTTGISHPGNANL